MNLLCAQSAALLWTFDASEGPDGTDVGRVIDIALRDDYVFALCDWCHISGERGISDDDDGGDEDHVYTVIRIENKVCAVFEAQRCYRLQRISTSPWLADG